MKKCGSMWGAILLFATAAMAQDQITQLTPKAEFIFSGTITLVRSATFDLEDVSEMAVVRVEEVLYGPAMLKNYKGKDVTVRLNQPKDAKPGSRLVFFAKLLSLGDSLGVSEIGSLSVGPQAGVQDIKAQIEKVKIEEADRYLSERLKTAELVVRGRVTKVMRVVGLNQASEHAPDWYEAEIRIERVLKGRTAGKRIKIFFPKSVDVAWYKAPKFEIGAKGIWLLRPFEYAGRKLERLTALEKIDYQPSVEEKRILRLVR
jgi:hypothetical protein